ncbi:Stp1/IreP family PP2C-type Ser/Thr phosphatase [bacterium]|nr:Stp1/IreP family PP2C-type Ser/Thr phosphatase [bacterium]
MRSHNNITICVKTDIGLRRKNNEDAYLIVTNGQNVQDYGMLFAVADGMGGHAYGEVASKMACEGLAEYYKKKQSPGNGLDFHHSRLHHLIRTIRCTNNQILRVSERNQTLKNMGTTLSVLVLLKGKALIAHVGDSRIYRLRQERLEQLTVDHTMAQFLEEEGEITPEEAIKHPARHVLTQVMGTEIEEIDTQIEQLQPGDLFLLCSDGMYDMVPGDDMLKILLAHSNVQAVCDQLLDAAIENGGRDNVTVIIVKV